MKILTISGFAQDPQLISKNITLPSTHLPYQSVTPQEIESYLLKYTDYDIIYAWSLGSLIAINYAHILKPKKLILYAPIYQYLKSPNFAHGIEETEFANFAEKLKLDEKSWFNYFTLLIAKGAPNFRELVKKLKEFDISQMHYKQQWLEYLKETKANLNNIENIETEIYHGELDHVVSYQQSQFIKKQLPKANLTIIKNSPHVCFI